MSRLTASPWFRLALGVGVSVLCLALALRPGVIDYQQVATSLRETSVGLVLVGLATVLITTYAKAVRWAVLVDDGRASDLATGWRLTPALVIGQMMNTVIPARVGEIARMVLGAEATGRGKAYLLGSIVLEKVIDGLCVIALAALVLPFLNPPGWLVNQSMVAAVGVIALTVAIAVVVGFSEPLLRLVTRLLRFLPSRWETRLTAIVAEAIRGLSGLRGWQARGRVVIWSAIVWVSAIATNWCIFLAVGSVLNDLGFVHAALLLIVTQIGGAAPATPLRLGVFHTIVVVALGLFAVPNAVALSYAVVLHLVVFGTQIVLGVLFLWRESLDVRRIATGPS